MIILKNKIITLTGHKYTNKITVAERLDKNSDVAFIRPYTDRPRDFRLSEEEENELFKYTHVSKEELDYMIKNEEVLYRTKINNHRYVFFKKQLTAPYNVLILDDYGVVGIREDWDGEIYSIRLVSDKEEQSDRVGEYLYQHEFDEVFDYDKDDFDELEARIV